MKFTKEEAVEKLNQLLTNNGKKPLRMSTRTLEGQIENLMSLIADEEMEVDAFADKVKGSLESINSNIEHDMSSFIKDYKEKNPAPKPTDPTPPQQTPPADPNQALLDRLNELERREQERDSKAAIASKTSEIRAFLAKKNVTDEKWIDKVLGMVPVGIDDDVETKGQSLLEFYNEMKSGGSPVPPQAPTPGSGNDAFNFDEVKALRKQKAEVQ